MYKVIYKHWKKDIVYEVIGEMPSSLNNEGSTRVIVIDENKVFHDIIKTTIISVEKLN